MLKLILALAVCLRLFFLDQVPPSLNWDEVSMGYTAYSLSETGMDEWGERLPLFFRSYGEWKSAAYIYLLVPFVKVLGLNAWAIRLPSALAGIVAVYLTYLIGKRLYSEKVGLWAALFLTLSPWHLMLSRPAFEANLSLTLILSGIYFFLQAAHTKYDIRYTIFSALALGLAPHTYNSAKVIVPFLVLYLVWQSRLYRQRARLILPAVILAVFALPLVINLFSGRSQFRYTQVGVTTDKFGLSQFIGNRQALADLPPLVGKLAFNKYTYTAHSFASNYLSYLNPNFLLLEAGDHSQHHLPYFGTLFLAEFVLLVLGLSALTRERSPLRLLPLVTIALGIIPAALTRDQGHVLRSILTLPGWQLLAALGITKLQNCVKRSRLFLILTSLFIIQATIFLAAYFVWYPRAFARDWQWGHQQVAEYLAEHESEYDHIVMTKWFGEPQLFLAFFNRWDPTWFQRENQSNLRYEEEGRLWLDQLPEYTLGKYTFKYLDLATTKPQANTLYIGKFDDFFENPDTLKTIYYPDGSVAFHLVEY